MASVRFLRAGARRLPVGVRTRLHKAAGRWSSSLVSVVVVVESADLPRLEDALRSVTAQGHRLLDIVVIPVGLIREDVAAVAGRLGDPRIRMPHVGPEARDWWDATSVSYRLVRGRWLTFLRGCDVLLPDAVSELLSAAREAQADQAVGGLDQFGQPDPWLRAAQAGPTGGDLRLLGRIVTAERWRESIVLPVDGDDWLCSVPAATVVARAASGIGRTPRPVYRYAPDHGQRGFGATPSPLPGLSTLPERMERIDDVVAGTPAAGEWRRHVAGVELPRMLADAERASAEEWAQLVELARSVGPHGDRVTARALVHLATEDRRTDVEALAEELSLLGGDIRTRRQADHVVLDAASVTLPDHIGRLREEETEMHAVVRRRWPTGALLYCRIDRIDLANATPEFEAYTVDGRALEARPAPDRLAERWARTRFQSAANGAVEVELPGSSAPGPVRIVMRIGEIVRETTVRIGASAPAIAATTPQFTDLTITDDSVVLSGAAGRAELPLTRSNRWSSSTPHPQDQWLPPGFYPLPATGVVAPDLLDRLPIEQVTNRHRVVVRCNPDGRLVVELAPPFGDSEAGPYHQERMQVAYAERARLRERPTEPGVVYFESYAGRTATDSPAAILAELQRRRPGLEAFWGILDHRYEPAAGAQPVLLRSQAHYDVLSRASLVVSNTDLDEWFVHRPDQLVVQTFHGYPSKSMGAMQWKAREFTPAHIRAIRSRTVDTWDLITTPTPAMTAHYREQYDYLGPVSEHGYPRDDALTPHDDASAAAADARRRSTRELLGVAEGQTAVLYAPTWRDHLATRPRAAEMADHLDLAQAADELGTGYVILLRGHRFHAAADEAARPGAARIVDVTDYPEINDLILASDAAILDYSSLRFDYALTKRPMIFLVPDLADYAEGPRGFLYPFTDSAPGPLVSTTDAVLAHLRDLPALRRSYADDLALFNETYHPHQDGHAASRVCDAIEALWP